MLPDNTPSPLYDPLGNSPAPRAPNAAAPMLVGLLMLLIGIVIGYLSHPALVGYISPSPTPAPTSTTAPSPMPTVDTAASATQAAYAAQLMDYVVANTRHFRGNVNAPVTLIEFSDFQ